MINDLLNFLNYENIYLIANWGVVPFWLLLIFFPNYQITNFEVLDSLINRTKPNKVYNKIIINYLNKKKVEKIVNVEYLK